jgi:hypothetical protein
MLIKIYICLTILLVVDTTLYPYERVSLPGQFSDWILLWIWLATTTTIVTLNFRKRWAKMYAMGLIVFTILTMLPMMIPFATIFAFAFNPQDVRYKVNNEITLQEHSKSVISIPTVAAIKSHGLYEKIIGETDFYFKVRDDHYRIQDATSIRQLSADNSDSLKIEFKFKNDIIIRTLK